MTISDEEEEGEDEVNTPKKAPVKEAKKKKKVAKEAKKKKVTKKVTKKKANKKKKAVVVENIKKTLKNGKVKYVTTGLFGVARGNISFRAKKKPVETGLEEFCYLDPVIKPFPEPAPQATSRPPQIEEISTSPKPAFKNFWKNEAVVKNFHGSIHINCRYTKVFSNQL